MQSIADTLGIWAASLDLEAVPQQAIDEAKRCLIDTIGVTLAGARIPTARTVHNLVRQEFAAGQCSIIGTRERSSSLGAALANGVSAHVLDLDDTCYDGIVHASAVVLPAAMAAAQLTDASGDDLLAAFIAGVEVEYALGRALTDSLFWRGWFNTGVLGTIGAAAAAARAMKLSEGQAVNAVRIATCQASGVRAMPGTSAKPCGVGHAAQSGVKAALLARDGIEGPEQAFESTQGFLRLFNEGLVNQSELSKLGTSYSLVNPGVAVKLYPVCSAAQAAAEVTQQLLVENEISYDQVARVDCVVTPLVAECLIYDRPVLLTESQFSMPFAVGCMLAYGELGASQITESTLQDPRLQQAMGKVSMTPSSELVATEEARLHNPEGARVTIVTNDGRVFERYNGAASGMPSKPLSDDDLGNKFYTCAKSSLTKEAIVELLKQIRSLEKISKVSELLL